MFLERFNKLRYTGLAPSIRSVVLGGRTSGCLLSAKVGTATEPAPAFGLMASAGDFKSTEEVRGSAIAPLLFALTHWYGMQGGRNVAVCEALLGQPNLPGIPSVRWIGEKDGKPFAHSLIFKVCRIVYVYGGGLTKIQCSHDVSVHDRRPRFRASTQSRSGRRSRSREWQPWARMASA